MNLIEGIQEEQQRCRELLACYEEISTGAFGAMIIRKALTFADESVAKGDIMAMMKAYEDLKGME